MEADALRALQAPLKTRYRDQPESALCTLTASGSVDLETVTCQVQTHAGPVQAGLHPAAGGDDSAACSATMLLEALVGCAGVTLAAVASALSIPVRSAHVTAEGDMDFRGTLGVNRETPVGLTAIRLRFQLDTDADDQQQAKLIELTERYCVVLRTLQNPPSIQTLRDPARP